MAAPPTPELPIPPHFDPERVGEVWRVDYASLAPAARSWRERHAIPPAAGDEPRVCLLLVDVQNTFCIPDHELFVGGRSGRGAVEDNVRLCRFVYRNLAAITSIRATMDTHEALQIFHPAFWVGPEGEHPEPLTAIGVGDVESGRWRVDPRVAAALGDAAGGDLDAYALHYVRRLAAADKYELMIWPYHAMLGGLGHPLVSAVHEAMFFHGLVRSSPVHHEVKGDRALTEHYSALSPEVTHDQRGEPIAAANRGFVETLLAYDRVAIAGQAKSHCLAWMIEDLLSDIRRRDPALARKVYLLEDCTSPVVIPGAVDFTEQADRAFERFAAAGMHVVRSTDPIADWPRP
ncbi:MAG TPA: isochorismatase [Thermoanaerobaculia bacterium]|nr:isochorismatase [Thermoanaerobaculia bacterium]